MSANFKKNNRLQIATAFSGGLAAVEFALRYESINHEIIFACEFDKYARQQYLKFHSKPKTFYEDIRLLQATKYLGSIDLFVWGSPCQDLSRRYVSGERVPFEFYISDGMKKVATCVGYSEISCGEMMGTENIINICLEHYYAALEKGVKPQEARRIIPQAAYTQIWGAFMPKQLDNYFKLRLDGHSQWEIRQTAIAMQELISK